MTPADMRARADWLEKWCEEKTAPAMLRAGANAIEEVERLKRERLILDRRIHAQRLRLHQFESFAEQRRVPPVLSRLWYFRKWKDERRKVDDARNKLATIIPQEPNHD